MLRILHVGNTSGVPTLLVRGLRSKCIRANLIDKSVRLFCAARAYV